MLAYWGGPDRPARSLRARLLKGDTDVESGLLYAAQESQFVLGVATTRTGSDGLRLRFDLAGVPFNAPAAVNGD